MDVPIFRGSRWAGWLLTCPSELERPTRHVQAMADYATLIWELREQLEDPDAPVIGFGG